jgi:hypothetical protein
MQLQLHQIHDYYDLTQKMMMMLSMLLLLLMMMLRFS